jgi:outer membrane protein assembly factor BamA
MPNFAFKALFFALLACSALTQQSLAQTVLRIRHILISPQPIFDESKPGERKRIFRITNKLHLSTREETIRAQLLFAEGDVYSERVLRETERNLRRLRFLREPQIREIERGDDYVDLEVRTTDVWTLSPTLSFGRSGGANRSSIGVEDLNFLGLGKQLKAEFLQSRDRDSKVLAYRDPNLAFGRWTLDSAYSLNSDGHSALFALEKPFYSLQMQNSFGLTINDYDGLLRRYALGEELGSYRRQFQTAELYFGHSAGLIVGWTQRRSMGVAFEKADFSNAANKSHRAGDTADKPLGSVGILPHNRRLALGFVQWEWLQEDFATTTNKDQIGRTEDEAFGQRYLLRAGLGNAKTRNADGTRGAGFYLLGASDGFRLSQTQSLFYQLSLSGRYENSGINDQLLNAEARYFYRYSDRNTSYLSLNTSFGRRLDLDQELTLGGEQGLRAYPVAFQTGDKSAVLTFEQRYFTHYQPFRLFSVGAAAFADVGRVWGNNAAGAPKLGTLKDIGIGLRLGNLRSARASMLHIDIAWPLDDPRGSSPQFSIETRTRF